MSSDYHARLVRNYATWVRHYLGGAYPAPYDPEALRGRPLAWTIGAYRRVADIFSNVQLCQRAGIEIGMLACAHFPQINMPEGLAITCVSKRCRSCGPQPPAEVDCKRIVVRTGAPQNVHAMFTGRPGRRLWRSELNGGGRTASHSANSLGKLCTSATWQKIICLAWP